MPRSSPITFFLALFPALLFLIALAGTFASADLITRIVNMMQGAVPPDVVGIIREQLVKIAQGESGGLMTFGMAATLWSSSAAMVALIDALNRAYEVKDERPMWKQRGTAILLTIGVALFMLVSFALVVAGPQAAEWLGRNVGLGAAFEWSWKILGGVMVLLLWLYMSGLVIIIGAEMNAEIEHASPHGKDVGEKVPGQRKVIGARAAREYRDKREQRDRDRSARCSAASR
ncbi:MAG: YihY/virulence factor BrkB family protein [Vicinamibacterales bacterium]